MNSDALIDRLARFPDALRAAVGVVSEADARWKPESGAWSILEIVCHLADEEADDFRARVFSTLRDPDAEWPGIDPEAWARDRGYNGRSLLSEVSRFVAERGKSVGWLRDVSRADWSRAYRHPKAGAIRAGDLLGAWAAHDALHLRQIAKRLHELAARDAGEYSTGYAGEWRA